MELNPDAAIAPSMRIFVAGYRGQIVFDSSKPDGTPRKLLDVSQLAALGWKARIGLEGGIAAAYRAAPFHAG